MNKKLYLGLIFIFVFKFSIGQELKGIVQSANTGELLANVSVTNLQNGKVQYSNENGSFSFINVEFPVKLKFSYLGFQDQTINFKSQDQNILVPLKPLVDELSEIVLRSSAIPQTLRNTPAAVSLITENELNRTDNFNLVQNFNFVPGVFVSQGALNTNKINIRGVGSRSQYSTNRIKAYINGIPLTTAEGELTLDDFDPEYIDRIEIYKGPVSSIFGAGLGGSINLYTKRDRKNQKTVASDFSYGSFHKRKSRAMVAFVKDSIDISFNYNNVKSDGYRDNGEYDRISMLGNAGLTTKGGNYWSFLFSTTNLKAFIPSSLNEQDFLNNPEKAAFTWAQAAGYESYNKHILGLSYEHNFSERFINQTSIFYNRRDGYEPRPFNILDDERTSTGFRTKFNLETSLFDRSTQIGFGSESMFEWYETGTFENNYEEADPPRSIQGEPLSFNKQYRNYFNFFAQLNMEVTSSLIVEAGLNFNSTSYELTDKFLANNRNQSGKYDFDPVLSPRLGLTYLAWNNKSIYASVSHGYSTPSVAETLTPEGLINTDLRTETGFNYEIGFKGNWLQNRLYTELNLYKIKIKDLLVARRVGEDQYVGLNAGKADRSGIEFTSAYRSQFLSGIQLSLFLNSNFNFFTFEEFLDREEDFSGNELPGSPEYMVSPGIEIEYQNYSANLNYQAFGEMALNDSNTVYTDPYQLLNFKFTYQRNFLSGFNFRFDFGINNIMNEHYASSVVTNAVGFGGSAPRYYYPGNPRNYYGSLGLKYSM